MPSAIAATVEPDARLQDDAPRLRRAYGLVSYFLTRVTTAGGTVLIAFPEEIIRLLLGEAWLGTAPILRVLGGYAIVEPVLGDLKSLIFARGKPVLNVWIRLAQTALFFPGIALAIWLESLPALALALVGSSAVGFCLGLSFNFDVAGDMVWRLFGKPLAAAVVAIALRIVASGLEPFAWVARSAWPFLPPLVFGGLIVLFEGRTLFSELSYLRRQLGGAGSATGTE